MKKEAGTTIWETIIFFTLAIMLVLFFAWGAEKKTEAMVQAEVEYTWYVVDTTTSETWELNTEPHMNAHGVTFTVPKTGDTVRVHGNFQIKKMVNR